MSLVIPFAVPLDRLASAAGLQMVANGICFLIGGPIIGKHLTKILLIKKYVVYKMKYTNFQV